MGLVGGKEPLAYLLTLKSEAKMDRRKKLDWITYIANMLVALPFIGMGSLLATFTVVFLLGAVFH